jgi:hypothetical protein
MIHSGSRIPDVKYYINRWLRVCLCVCVCVCVCVYDVTQPSALGPLAALCRDRLAQLELLLADGPLERDPVPPPRLHHLGPRARRNVHTAEERRNNQTAATTNSSSNTSVLQMRWHGMSADDTPGAQEKRKKIARKPENRKNLAIAEMRTKNQKKTKKKTKKKHHSRTQPLPCVFDPFCGVPGATHEHLFPAAARCLHRRTRRLLERLLELPRAGCRRRLCPSAAGIIIFADAGTIAIIIAASSGLAARCRLACRTDDPRATTGWRQQRFGDGRRRVPRLATKNHARMGER